jgi:hypothetical protein
LAVGGYNNLERRKKPRLWKIEEDLMSHSILERKLERCVPQNNINVVHADATQGRFECEFSL